MAHFADVDENGVVVNVIVVDNANTPGSTLQETEASGRRYLQKVNVLGNWVQTSYNNNFRRRYACIGMTYSAEHDVFLYPQPFPSWSLDLENENDYSPPVPRPVDPNFLWIWDEEGQTWMGKEKPQVPEVVTLGE